jgi:plastocyanin
MRGVATVLATLATATVAQAATHVVTIEAMAFSPATLTIRRGDTVVWNNKDVVPHTATARGQFDSGNIAAGKRWSHAMGKAGSYRYVCAYHPGMVATVVVQ